MRRSGGGSRTGEKVPVPNEPSSPRELREMDEPLETQAVGGSRMRQAANRSAVKIAACKQIYHCLSHTSCSSPARLSDEQDSHEYVHEADTYCAKYDVCAVPRQL